MTFNNRPVEYVKFNQDPCIDITAFREFVVTVPFDEQYDYGDPRDCPVGRYLRSIGEPAYARAGGCLPKSLQVALNKSSYDGAPTEATYGRLLTRLETLEVT